MSNPFPIKSDPINPFIPLFWLGAAGIWRISDDSKLVGRDCIANPIGNMNATDRFLAAQVRGDAGCIDSGL